MSDKLECRIVLLKRPDGKTEVGMYDPLNLRYESLGVYGGPSESSQVELEKVVRDLAVSIERAGHRLTFCERTLK